LGKDVHEAKLSLNCRIATLIMVGFLERCFVAFGSFSPALCCIFPLCSKDAAAIGFKLRKPVQYTYFINPIEAEILFVAWAPETS